ncbi:MAG: rhomboid family intramembrane serine protease [Planctomycetota bacterium]|nr:rhomboid family intramembrane serine protease [Planctomycetota bacterium]
MRHLTTITGKSNAESFVAYLLTQNIPTHVEPTSDANEWDVWIRDEDKLELAKKEYQQFAASPEDARYDHAIDHAKAIIREKKQKSIEYQKNTSYAIPRSRVSPNMFGGSLPPLTLTLIIVCVILSLASEFTHATGEFGGSIVKQLLFVDLESYQGTGDPAASIKQGEVWRIFTPAFLHGDPLHLLFNMLSLASLGRLIERLEGIGRFAFMVFLIAMVSHLLQGLMPVKWYGSPNFVGISGVVFGLLGYIATKTNLRPDLGIYLPSQVYLMTGLILVFGFTTSTKGFALANLAHVGGLVAGIVIGFVMSDRRFDVR